MGKKFKFKGSLLDVGCGDGLISCLLAKNSFMVKGIDIEARAIEELARVKCSFAEFKVENVFDVKEIFDYLLASEIIEHLTNPDNFLQKINKLFKKEALITTPNKIYQRNQTLIT